MTVETTRLDYPNIDLTLDELLSTLRDPSKRDQFTVAVDTKGTNKRRRQSENSDSFFTRLAAIALLSMPW